MSTKLISKIFNIIGIVMMVAVIAATIPLTVPKVFGYHIYNVLSGSMLPTYPIGSAIYVKDTSPEDIVVGDVITFSLGEAYDVVMTHRVVDIDTQNGVFITKGDANTTNDADGVLFSNLVGKAVFCVPNLGALSDTMHTTEGIVCIVGIFIFALLLWVMAEKGKHGNALQMMIRSVAFLAIIFAVVNLFRIGLDYKVADDEYAALQDQVMPDAKPVEATEADEIFVPNKDIVDSLPELIEDNPDTVGWLAFDKIDINYPLVQAEDNYFYLTRTFQKTENKAGAIFMDGGSHRDLLDFHTLIYGHNMKNGSMFGKLKKYYEEEFFTENQFFTIYETDGAYRYQIFSAHTISDSDEIYTLWYQNGEGFDDFVARMKKDSWYDTGVDVTAGDRVVTLSTCTASDDKRFVVHGKLIALVKYE